MIHQHEYNPGVRRLSKEIEKEARSARKPRRRSLQTWHGRLAQATAATYPFVPVKAMPWTKYFWARKKIRATGMTATMLAAMM